tara:strand:- start:116 stop:553 length:438 start_codon:yes stop_codon:yes gene_type:complete
MTATTTRDKQAAMPSTNDLASLLLRLALGLMFLAHGLTKLLVWTLAGTAQFFASAGFPGWLAYPITGLELVGGALLILGVQVRWLALLLGVELAFAVIPHLGNGWMFQAPHGGWEYPAFLSITAFALALMGEGRYALMRSYQPSR